MINSFACSSEDPVYRDVGRLYRVVWRARRREVQQVLRGARVGRLGLHQELHQVLRRERLPHPVPDDDHRGNNDDRVNNDDNTSNDDNSNNDINSINDDNNRTSK